MTHTSLGLTCCGSPRSSSYHFPPTDRGRSRRRFATFYIGSLLSISVLNLTISNYLDHHPELTDGQATKELRQHRITSAFTMGHSASP